MGNFTITPTGEMVNGELTVKCCIGFHNPIALPMSHYPATAPDLEPTFILLSPTSAQSDAFGMHGVFSRDVLSVIYNIMQLHAYAHA